MPVCAPQVELRDFFLMNFGLEIRVLERVFVQSKMMLMQDVR